MAAIYSNKNSTVINNPGGGTGDIQYNGNGTFKGNSNLQIVTNNTGTQLNLRGNLVVSGYVKGKIVTNPTNFFITGGTFGQVLTTDGTGNIIWTTLNNNYGNNQVANYLPVYNGNISVNTITASVTNSAVVNVTGTVTVGAILVQTIANLGNVSNIRVLGGTNGQFLRSYGNNSVYFDTVTMYSNTNATALLSSYTGNVTANNITASELIIANTFKGDGSKLTSLSGANVTGIVANANYASFAGTAYSISASNVTGLSNVATSGNYSDLTNLPVLGNISTISLDGNSSNILYGNGTFGSVPGVLPLANGNTNFDIASANGEATITVNGDRTFTFGQGYLDVPKFGVYEEYGRIRGNGLQLRGDTNGGGSYASIIIPNNDDSVGNALTIASEQGNVLLWSNSQSWTFDVNGNVTLPGNGIISNPINSSLDPINPNVSTLVFTPDQNYSYQSLVLDPTAVGHIHLRSPSYSGNIDEPAANLFLGGELSSFEVGASYGGVPNVYVHSNNYTWTFDTDGVLTIPGNLVASGASPAPTLGGFSSLSAVDSISVGVANIYSNGHFVGNTANFSGDISANNLGNISGINLDGNASNILYGNGVFAAPAPSSSYGDSNVSSLLSSFGSNSISTTGNVSAGNVSVTGAFNGTSLTVTSTGTAINAGQGNILTNKITGTKIVFLHGLFNSTLQGNATASSDLTFTLPPTTGANGQVLATDGNGNLSWTTPSSGSNYTDTNVATFLASFGSNTISTTGNANVGNLRATNAVFTGTSVTGVNSVLAGPTFTPLSNTMAGFVSNVNSYTQLTIQNKNNGADATTDFIATADNGSDTVNYIDLGIINSGYDANTPTNSLGNIVYAADGYLYTQGNASATSQSGGNLAIGTTVAGKSVRIFAGGVNTNSIVGTFSSTGLTVNGNVSTTGKFVGDGSALTNVTVSVAGNIVGSNPNVTLVAGSYSYTFDNTGILTLPAVGGDEGAELNLGIPATNTTLANVVKVDVYQDRIRFFDGSTKGAYIDLSQAATGVATLLNNRVSGFVNAGTFVTMDNIKATVTTSGNRALALATVSGSFSAYVSGVYAVIAGGTGGTGAVVTVTTSSGNTPVIAWNFTGQGDTATYIINDTTNNRGYRITMMIGGSYNNNMISIERLV